MSISRVLVGRVGRPHGLSGAFVVEHPSDDQQRFSPGAELYAGGEPSKVVESKRAGGEVKTAGGRVLAVTALGSTLEAARARAYEAVSRIHFENCHYRHDIALGVTN